MNLKSSCTELLVELIQGSFLSHCVQVPCSNSDTYKLGLPVGILPIIDLYNRGIQHLQIIDFKIDFESIFKFDFLLPP